MAFYSSLSVGKAIRHLLLQDKEVTSITKKIFPIAIDQVQMPYILYRRAGMVTAPTKSNAGTDTAIMEVVCCAANYTQSIDLAERVRNALEYKRVLLQNINIRCCILTDSEEGFEGDVFYQRLTFNITV